MNPCSSPRSVFSMRAGRGRRCHPRASRSRCIQFLSLWIQLHLLKIEQEGSHTMWLDLLFWYSIGGFSWFNSKRWDCITMEHWQRERKKLTKTRWCPRFYFWTGACFNLSPLNFFLRFYYLTSFFIFLLFRSAINCSWRKRKITRRNWLTFQRQTTKGKPRIMFSRLPVRLPVTKCRKTETKVIMTGK